MRLHRLAVTDLFAGMLVAGAMTVYIAGLYGADLGGTRARASAVFLLGAFACGMGARRGAFEAGAATRAVAALTAVGVVTLIVGVTAMVLGSESYLTALVVGIDVLWLGATTRHLLSAPGEDKEDTSVDHQPRELVKR